MTGIARIPSMCRARGCTEFTLNEGGRCDQHRTQQRREYNEQTAYYHTPEWRALRRACLDRDYNQCVVCTGTTRLTAHHIKARASGGMDHLDNLVTLDGRCHSKLEAGDPLVRDGLARHLAMRP